MAHEYQQIPQELTRRKSMLSPDNLRIGENIRYWFLKRRTHAFPPLRLRDVAHKAGIAVTSLSRILRGTGTTEERLISIADALGIQPGRLLVGVRDRSKYPNIPAMRGEQSRTSAGRAFSRIDSLFLNDRYISSFVGGCDPETLDVVKTHFWKIREYCRKQREIRMAQNAYPYRSN